MKKSHESRIFNKVFPDTPLIGLEAEGEIGWDCYNITSNTEGITFFFMLHILFVFNYRTWRKTQKTEKRLSSSPTPVVYCYCVHYMGTGCQ